MVDPTTVFDRPIAFQRGFVSLGCGITGALMLSQAVYWSKRTSNAYGWFYKTAEEWEEETGLTRREQETARAKLSSIGVLQEVKKGLPCKLFYRVDFDVLLSLSGYGETSLNKSAKLDCTKVPNSNAQKRHSSTENTTENTTDIYGTSDDAPTVVDQGDVSPVSEQEAAKAAKPYPDEFEWIWNHKPERAGGNGKKSAYNACRARIKAGATWRELAEGLKRYAAHCKADGKIGTPYVMQMATFFGPDEHFRNDWKAAAKPASFPEHSGPDRSITIIEARQAVAEMTEEERLTIARTREELKKLTEKL